MVIEFIHYTDSIKPNGSERPGKSEFLRSYGNLDKWRKARGRENVKGDIMKRSIGIFGWVVVGHNIILDTEYSGEYSVEYEKFKANALRLYREKTLGNLLDG